MSDDQDGCERVNVWYRPTRVVPYQRLCVCVYSASVTTLWRYTNLFIIMIIIIIIFLYPR